MISLERLEAIRSGSNFYFTGKPCKRNHNANRYVNSRRCVECCKETPDKRWLLNPEKERIRSREYQRRRFKPSRPCPDTCELCGGPPTNRSLHLDHDHTTNKFRGWLCHYCNTNIGRFGDSIEGLQKAIDYLRKNTE